MFNTKDGMPREDSNVDEAQMMNIKQDRSPETLKVLAEMENEDKQVEDSFLSPNLDKQPLQEEEAEVKEEV